MAVEIEEVIGRSEQGITEPYICRGVDNYFYYVKGRGANYDSLIREWVAGRLARLLELPLPPFSLMDMPRELYELGRDGLLRDLGHGLLFGSRQIPNVNELTFTKARALDPELKRHIAAFDWWVMNGDRTLSEAGGNPNILWCETDDRIYIIDHNLAFDETITLRSQLETHVFAEVLDQIRTTPALRTHYRLKFDEALSALPEIIKELPERWHYLDDGLSVESPFSIDVVEATLARHRKEEFWKLI